MRYYPTFLCFGSRKVFVGNYDNLEDTKSDYPWAYFAADYVGSEILITYKIIDKNKEV